LSNDPDPTISITPDPYVGTDTISFDRPGETPADFRSEVKDTDLRSCGWYTVHVERLSTKQAGRQPNSPEMLNISWRSRRSRDVSNDSPDLHVPVVPVLMAAGKEQSVRRF
jgi:hypothetical protein